MKFKYDQQVTTKGGEQGIILSYSTNHDFYDGSGPVPAYKIEFTRKDLMPPHMWYPEYWLTSSGNDEACPVCKTEWLVTKMGNHVWKDCKPCGKRAEDIESELKEKDSLPPIPDDQVDFEF